MSNRDLAGVAAIVWGIAVLVGVLIAAPLWFGFDVDAGLIINALAALAALAALGAFAAAAAAVWVATTDRRVRIEEGDAEDEAQAALVIAQPFRSGEAGLGVAVQNYGTLSILQVTTVKLDVEAHPHLDLRRMPGGRYNGSRRRASPR